MKICAIGDPHGNIKGLKSSSLKSSDLILLTGDIGKADLARKFYFENQERMQKGLPKLKETPEHEKKSLMEIHNSTVSILKYLSRFAPVYSIQGNVEISKCPKIKNVKLVSNRLIKINGLRIGFLEYFIDTSWVKEFKPKDFKKSMKNALKDSKKAKNILRKFGKVDILVCHQPPYGKLDKVNFPGAPKSWQGKHAGSKVILEYIKKYQPNYVFCGHIHESKGKVVIGKTKVYNLGSGGHAII